MICCLSGGMPMPVSDDRERDHLVGAVQLLVVRRPAAVAPRAIVSVTCALVRELEGVRQQVLDDLLQPLRRRCTSSSAAAGRAGSRSRSACSRRSGGRCARRALQVVEAQLADVHHHRAGLDLRQVEDVVDEHQQVVARRVDRLGELDLLAAQVALRVLAQLVGQDQQAVQRRAQLVRHVGEELALVLGGERELLGLLLQRLAGLLDLGVLALDLLVLVRQQPGLLLQLLVGLLQLLLAALQLLRERLRLLQQVLGAACSPRSC